MDDLSINLTEPEATALLTYLEDEIEWLTDDDDFLTPDETAQRELLSPIVARLRRVLKLGAPA